mmetsp:Transcript_9934/g.37029  ORF Transcript_9934/g.37029 Transcript_9934/m.37029 type:complete len:432 (-) Transcript_9934:394-1689(-)|eukprot:CAMPEP_0117444552 /NCGR_PEP_ID=MMETSP0759-20121206/5302_1 /TAXON_ID=63605 /ORGANISM="Percolomonas cosmopolitus, Strain WS" /LENGTH=431 /DNA_ID=CAMNT_0005236627 /DNA_START=172 /DNA_END=1467 /DNA_ORIENTATION=+
MFNKENRSPNVTASSLNCLDDHFQVFKEELNHLLRWIRAGENEIYLRQQFDLNPKNGYSIPIFDFIVYFKEADLSRDSVLPFKYMRRLHLSEYLVKVQAQTKKYQNFHKKHDIVLKVWHQLVRIIGSTPSCNRSTSNTAFSDAILERLNFFQQSRLSLIRKYMQRCQQKPQSKTEQLRYLQTILKLFLQIENEEEKLTENELTPGAAVKVASLNAAPLNVTGLDGRLRQLDFCRLWRTRYNNDSRIVVNTTDEQLEQRQMFCQSSNSLTAFFDWFSKNPCSAQNILTLAEHIGAFAMLNNSRNAYNCSIGSMKNLINGRYFSFSIQEFVTDLLPYLRCCMHTLSRIAVLQSQKHLSLFESFWDISFMTQALNIIRHAVLQNTTLQAATTHSLSSIGALKSKANGFKKRFMGSKDRGFLHREETAAMLAAVE